jgi:2-polyprenyl-3-methyl-5-hydroxy-6-metoxy-1,4-benzoquinol methylase
MRDWKIYERIDPSNESTYYLYRIHLDRYLSYVGLANGLTVLDVGCAYGFGSAALGKKAERVIGIDTSIPVVKEAKKRYGSSKIDFVVMSAEHLGLREHAIQGAFAFEVVEHLTEPDTFFEDIERTISETGFLVLSTPNRLESKDNNPFHISEYSPEELNNSLHKHFSTVMITGTQQLPMFDKMMSIRRLLPHGVVERVKGNRPFEFLIDRFGRQKARNDPNSSPGLLAICRHPWNGLGDGQDSFQDHPRSALSSESSRRKNS